MILTKKEQTEVKSPTPVLISQPRQSGSQSPVLRSSKGSTPAKPTRPNIKNINIKEENPNQLGNARGFSLPLQSTERDGFEPLNKNKSNLPPLVIKSRMNDGELKSISGRNMNESKSALIQIKKLLEEDPKKAEKNSEENKTERNRLIDDDYDAVGVQPNKVEDKEHVKNLDRWRLEVKRNKILSSMDKLTGLLDGYRQKKTKNNDDTPLVNIDALNRILVESEDEEEGSKREHNNEKETVLNNKDENSFKGIENAIQEGNQELINALVLKKVKAHFENQPFDSSLKNQQLKLQIKMIAESIILRFKGLKGFVSEVFIQSQVDMVLKKLKMRKAQSEAIGVLNFPQVSGTHPDEEKTGVDYHIIEATLLKNYEQAVEECHVLTKRLTELNHQNFKLKKELANHMDQVVGIFDFVNEIAEKIGDCL